METSVRVYYRAVLLICVVHYVTCLGELGQFKFGGKKIANPTSEHAAKMEQHMNIVANPSQKKETSSRYAALFSKRPDPWGFFAARGKRMEDAVEELEQSQIPLAMMSRSESRPNRFPYLNTFIGVRGKKAYPGTSLKFSSFWKKGFPAMNSFFGVRGKKQSTRIGKVSRFTLDRMQERKHVARRFDGFFAVRGKKSSWPSTVYESSPIISFSTKHMSPETETYNPDPFKDQMLSKEIFAPVFTVQSKRVFNRGWGFGAVPGHLVSSNTEEHINER